MKRLIICTCLILAATYGALGQDKPTKIKDALTLPADDAPKVLTVTISGKITDE